MVILSVPLNSNEGNYITTLKRCQRQFEMQISFSCKIYHIFSEFACIFVSFARRLFPIASIEIITSLMRIHIDLLQLQLGVTDVLGMVETVIA